jgi:hypothetical protein
MDVLFNGWLVLGVIARCSPPYLVGEIVVPGACLVVVDGVHPPEQKRTAK